MADTRKIFSGSGIQKLTELKSKLQALLVEDNLKKIQNDRANQADAPINTAGEMNSSASSSSSTTSNKYVAQKNQFMVSDVSKNMVNAVLEIIDLVLENNEINFFLKEKNRERINQLALQIDSGKGIYVADIFNEQSYQLALLEKEWITNLNLSQDLQEFNTIKTLLKPFLDIEKTLDSIKQHLQMSCHLYEILLTAPRNYATYRKYSNEIRSQYEQFINKVEKQIKSQNSSALLMNTDMFFESDYQTFCQTYFDLIASLPYVRVAENGQYVDQEGPYLLRKDELVLSGMRAALFLIMLNSEKTLNEQLKKAKLPLVTVVYDYLNDQYKEGKYQAILEEFKNIITDAQTEFKQYKAGDHLKSKLDLGLFSFEVKIKSVDEKKILIFEQCLSSMEKTRQEKKSIGEKVFSAAEYLFNAVDDHNDVVSEKKISLGQLSKILNELMARLLILRFEKIDQTNDDALGRQLGFYRQDLNIASEPHVSVGMKM